LVITFRKNPSPLNTQPFIDLTLGISAGFHSQDFFGVRRLWFIRKLTMILATYNLHWGGNGSGKQHLKYLHSITKYDLLFLQEAFDPKIYGEDNYIWKNYEGRKWGSGIVCKTVNCSEVDIKQYYGSVVAADIDDGSERYRVVSIHNPRTKEHYVNSLNKIVDELNRIKTENMIIGGDFNLCSLGYRKPGEVIKTNDDEIKIIKRLENEIGVVNSWSYLHPNDFMPQTLRWNNAPTIPYHCDGIFMSKTLIKRIKESFVICDSEIEKLSDHNPVVTIME
jgi:endonuclease/exonuclease/phosphatase family metal-dependent hydrolase